MSIYEKLAGAMKNRQISEFTDLYHDDFRFISHQDGSSLDKEAFTQMVGQFMASDAMEINAQRCVYENEDILVSHSIIDFPDGTREAVLTAHLKKDGKIIQTETGATPLAR